MDERGGSGVLRGIFGSGRGHSGCRKPNTGNNHNRRQEMKIYPHGTGLDQ